MKATNKCPKCSGTEIYTDDSFRVSKRSNLGISNWLQIRVSAYICMNCGFIEEYVTKSDLTNSKKLGKIKENWKRNE